MGECCLLSSWLGTRGCAGCGTSEGIKAPWRWSMGWMNELSQIFLILSIIFLNSTFFETSNKMYLALSSSNSKNCITSFNFTPNYRKIATDRQFLRFFVLYDTSYHQMKAKLTERKLHGWVTVKIPHSSDNNIWPLRGCKSQQLQVDTEVTVARGV